MRLLDRLFFRGSHGARSRLAYQVLLSIVAIERTAPRR
jgi:hypothetical protein